MSWRRTFKKIYISITRFTEHKYYLHFVLLFWNHVLTCASVILSVLAKEALSAEARYFCLWNLFSSSQICIRVKLVRGFFLFGGVRFWYGWPMRRGGIGGRPVDKEKGTVKEGRKWNLIKLWNANDEMLKIIVKLAINWQRFLSDYRMYSCINRLPYFKLPFCLNASISESGWSVWVPGISISAINHHEFCN